jgi:hypothetical protein
MAFFGSKPPGPTCRQPIILAPGSEDTQGVASLEKLTGKPQPPSEQITNDQDCFGCVRVICITSSAGMQNSIWSEVLADCINA